MENNKTGIFDGTSSGPVSQSYMTGHKVKSIDEEAILARCRKGNMVAYGQLIDLYQDRLFNAIYRMTGHYDDALELTQEAFFRALKNIGRFRGNAGFYTWLFRIGINLCLSHRRRAGKVHFASLDEPHAQNNQAQTLLDMMESSNNRGPERQAELKEEHARALEALDKLDEDHRAVVIMRDIEDLSYNQIARILEQPVGTIKSRLFRARMTLRNYLNHK